ncbi:hypothetical protein KKF81_02860 [Candidatus Micrarchaeota archaeon]|nr:hypothetical protein [Candidatus Micrarchaeota archaeon]MBU1165863.1 hypothetical protein [Candidatus Micrarchaeota archaeon]MBU1886364.1 hypothetical protein [Candidatus Micrarchaeota archaeon]
MEYPFLYFGQGIGSCLYYYIWFDKAPTPSQKRKIKKLIPTPFLTWENDVLQFCANDDMQYESESSRRDFEIGMIKIHSICPIKVFIQSEDDCGTVFGKWHKWSIKQSESLVFRDLVGKKHTPSIVFGWTVFNLLELVFTDKFLKKIDQKKTEKLILFLTDMLTKLPNSSEKKSLVDATVEELLPVLLESLDRNNWSSIFKKFSSEFQQIILGKPLLGSMLLGKEKYYRLVVDKIKSANSVNAKEVLYGATNLMELISRGKIPIKTIKSMALAILENKNLSKKLNELEKKCHKNIKQNVNANDVSFSGDWGELSPSTMIYNLGSSELINKRYKNAIELLELAMMLPTQNWMAYNNLFAAYWYSGKFQKGRLLAEADIVHKQAAPNNPYIYHHLACFYVKFKEYDKAIEQVRLAKVHGYPLMASIQRDVDLMPLWKMDSFKAALKGKKYQKRLLRRNRRV